MVVYFSCKKTCRTHMMVFRVFAVIVMWRGSLSTTSNNSPPWAYNPYSWGPSLRGPQEPLGDHCFPPVLTQTQWMQKISVTVSVKSAHECKSAKLKPPQRRGLPRRWRTKGRISGLEETAPRFEGIKVEMRKSGRARVAPRCSFGRQKQPG